MRSAGSRCAGSRCGEGTVTRSRRRALAAQAENVLVTRGSQMALSLLGRVLCGPGDVVAVIERHPDVLQAAVIAVDGDAESIAREGFVAVTIDQQHGLWDTAATAVADPAPMDVSPR